MEKKSIWKKDINTNKNNIQKEIPKKTDILIIGGGITGLTTAFFLKNSKWKITLIDKGKIGCGITSKSTAKITYLQGIIYQTLEKIFSKDISKEYLNSQKDAITIIRNIILTNGIICDFESVDSIVFTNKKENIYKIKKEKKLLEEWNINTEEVNDERIEYGIKVDNTYVFNPVKYMNGLKNIIKDYTDIYTDTLAKEIKKENNQYKVSTNKGEILCKRVVVCCHYPFFLYPSFIPFKTYVKREFVCASSLNYHKKFSAINIDKELISIRFYKNYVLFGSNEQRLTSKLNYQKGYQKSREDFKKIFHKEPIYSWMNQDIVSNDQLPFIGEVEKNLFIATAYNAWGMTNGTIAGKIISDLILTGKSKYKQLFHPKRMDSVLIINSIMGSFHYLFAYFKAVLNKNNPYYIKRNGINYAIYKDSKGTKHKIKLICPHMKCGLVFNKEEKTWDCPCHGSRFDLDGNIIETPSVKELKNDEQSN